jgi:YidC/Oxa1 family membrane protein insertase
MSLFAAFDAVIGAAHATIEGLAALLSPLAGGTAAAVAIVLFTVAVRLLISPLSYLQIRNERRRAALAPRLTELQHKHRDDPATLVSETFALYRANGAGPMTGLLPGVVQAPFFMIMYRVALNAPPGSFVGVPLSAHLTAGVPAFAVLLAIAAVLAWLSSRRIRRTAAAAPTRPTRSEPGPGARGGSGALAVMMPWLPFAALPAVAWLPLAGALYLVTSMAWTALERSVAFPFNS